MRVYALGGDPRMLRQAGVGEGRLRAAILLVMGCFTAAGMLVMLGRLGAAAPTAGFGLELDAIVAVVIGGASFRGGTGRLRRHRDRRRSSWRSSTTGSPGCRWATPASS